MKTWQEILKLKKEVFLRFGVEFARYTDDSFSVEVALSARIGDRASIGTGARIGDGASIGDRASIGKSDRWCSLGPLGSDGRMLTVVCSKKSIRCYTGCFTGTDAEFLKAVKIKHGDSPLGVEYRAALAYAVAKMRA